jgi:predicted nucleic acid-binding protein
VTLVVDASIALDWCFESERTERANQVLDAVLTEGALVPTLWPAEVANGLVHARRRSRITPAGIKEALSLLHGLRIQVVEQERDAALASMVEVAEQFGLTAYDAAYLALAMRTGSQLATSDDALAQAAAKAGVVNVPRSS